MSIDPVFVRFTVAMEGLLEAFRKLPAPVRRIIGMTGRKPLGRSKVGRRMAKAQRLVEHYDRKAARVSARLVNAQHRPWKRP